MNLTLLASCLYTLFTTRADELAATTLFIKRQRRLSGASFLQALTSVWSTYPAASLERLALPMGIARQSLEERFTPSTTAFCRSVLREALDHTFAAHPEVLPLLKPFQGTYIDDCTQVPLPDACADEFPGCGSGDGDTAKAGMKIFTRLELQGGRIQHLNIHSARTAETKAAAEAPPLPAGSLLLADLGFVDFGRMQDHTEQGVYFISRLPVQTSVRLPDGMPSQPLAELLRARRLLGQKQIDLGDVEVGTKQNARATGRLTLLACPEDVVETRLRKLNASAKRRGRQVSARQQEMCRWQVLFSNVPPTWLSTTQVWQVYRLRWQVELLFKRFKSQGGMGKSSSGKPERVKCEWYVKLLIQVVNNWLMLSKGGPLANVNQVLLAQVVQDWAKKVFEAIRSGLRSVRRILGQLRDELKRLRPRTRRKKNKSASQWFGETPTPG
jgi:hypothetical protein